MRLNLLINVNEPLTRGPGRRAKNLVTGLQRLGVPFDVCSDDFEWAVGMQAGCVSARWERLPAYTPIGPNVMHCPADHLQVAAKFKNFVVQSDWVADYWRWQNPEESKGHRLFTYPASVDISDGYEAVALERKPTVDCLFYTKYQSSQNREVAEQLYKARNHSVVTIVYGEYSLDQLRDACARASYCIFNSCCEKSSNALMEIMACGIPVYVIEQKKWIGDDRFDRCTAAPHFSDACGTIGDFWGRGLEDFHEKRNKGLFDPFKFVKENYTVEKIAEKVVDIVKECHG